ncbi:MAG TPA: pantoate--beta-alanine ligase [Rhodanobacteraceae bacterium]|nr:pantoate--beta-alanine ligase [Rhodanobacteraceae bacterium]
MQTVTDAARLRAVVRTWREQGRTVGLVPTMGNLHAGHLALLKLARSRCEQVVTSIFVNPTQFGPNEDYARYPRTLEQDQSALADNDCDLLFAPSVDVMYPFGPEHSVSVHVPGVTEVLEGAHRPGHFDGVATVVAKLFHLVQPDVAVFGQKDYQQLRVIERMVKDLSLPVNVVGAPTRRDADGLALSSRNQYLSAEERRQAPQLYTTLRQMRELHLQGHARQAIEQAATARLERAGFSVDYLTIRRADDLAEPGADEREGLIALVAARLGSTRLIDNLPFS